MVSQPNRDRSSFWPGLMYATGVLLINCGVPATILLALSFYGDRAVDLDRSDALLFGSCMIAAELIVAGILICVADRLTKQKRAKK